MNILEKKTTATLLIAIFLLSTLAVAVSALPLIDYPDGTAEWSDLYASTGSWSVELTSGTEEGVAAGRIEIPIYPILFQDLTSDPSYMVYETAVTLDTNWGGEWPVTTTVPWGHPYVNIILDLDGNLATTDDIDRLEGVGSTAATVSGGVATPPTVNEWTEMYEGWGYYDDFDSIIGEGWSSDISGGEAVVHTLAQWKTEMDTAHPNAKVVGIQVTYGFWLEEYMALANTNPVYVDDITVGALTYNLEFGGVTVTSNVLPLTVSISVTETLVDFGPIKYGQDSGTETITVTNDGDVDVTVTADIEVPFYRDHLTINTVAHNFEEYELGWDLGEITLVVPNSATYTLQLVAVDDIGSHSGTLVFVATPVGP